MCTTSFNCLQAQFSLNRQIKFYHVQCGALIWPHTVDDVSMYRMFPWFLNFDKILSLDQIGSGQTFVTAPS